MKLISYSLWGNKPKYVIGAIKNANLAREFYPGWVCRFYCTNDVPKNIIDELKKTSQVILCDEPSNWKFATKRFLPMSEQGIERVIFRDTDSRFSLRETSAVDDWIASGEVLHVMKDHPYHGGFPILAGMFGIMGGYVSNIEELLKKYTVQEQYHYDQIFLKNHIWSLFKNQSIIHDEFFNKKPFPIKRNNLEFVGEPFNEDDTPCDPTHRKILSDNI